MTKLMPIVIKFKLQRTLSNKIRSYCLNALKKLKIYLLHYIKNKIKFAHLNTFYKHTQTIYNTSSIN